jgi:hypothetical protein
MLKFLKSFWFEYKFVVSIVEEDAVIDIKELAVDIPTPQEPESPIAIKSFDIDSILSQKITEVPILDVISELKQKELEACYTADERREKDLEAEFDEYHQISKEVKKKYSISKQKNLRYRQKK